MKKAFALLAGLVSAVAGQSAFAGGFGSSGYGSSGYSAGYGSSGYSTYAGYGSSGYSSGYGSSGYSSGYGSSGYSSGYGSSGYSSGYGISGYSAGYGSSGYAARPHHRLFGHHHRRAAAYGSSGYSAGYGSSGYSSGYGSSGYYSGYGSSGYSSGYGSSGYSTGYGSSGYSSGYGSSGYSTGYGSSGGSSGGSTYYGASNSVRYNGTTYGVAGTPPYAAPAGYHWEQRGTVANAVPGSTTVASTTNQPPYPAPAGYHWEQRSPVAGTIDKTYGAAPYGSSTNPPYAAPEGYHWEQRGTAPATPVAPVKDDGASVNGNGQMRLVQSSTELKSDEIQLTVNVPESARIFVNGNATTSTGASRQFVSRGLDPKQDYRFEVRVENTVNGKDLVDTKTIVLSPGQGEVLSFDLRDSNSPVETILTLNVPADATVVLAGNETKTTGSARTYRTKDLKSGQVWDDYTVVVTSNGVIKEKTIRLIAGDDLELTFSFEDRVAMR